MKEIEEDKGIEEDKSSEGRLIKLSRYFFKKISDFFGKISRNRAFGPGKRARRRVRPRSQMNAAQRLIFSLYIFKYSGIPDFFWIFSLIFFFVKILWFSQNAKLIPQNRSSKIKKCRKKIVKNWDKIVSKKLHIFMCGVTHNSENRTFWALQNLRIL